MGLPTEFGHVGASGGPDPANQIIGTDEWTLHDNNTHTGSHGPKGTGGVAQWSSTETQRSTATWHKQYNATTQLATRHQQHSTATQQNDMAQTTQCNNTARQHGTHHTPRHSTAKQNKQHKQDSTATRGSTSTQHKEHKQHSTAAPHNNTM